LIDAAGPLCSSESVFRRIAQAKECQAVLDYLAEIKFALIFAGLRFEVRLEPCGRDGPDLLVSRDGRSSYVEVRRCRPPDDETDLPCLPEVSEEFGDGLLVPYGDLEKGAKWIEDELSAKFRQISEGTGIIALWSDRLAIEEVEFEVAIRHLRIDFANGIKQIPAGLLFCIFGWDWFTGSQRFHCGILRELEEPFAIWASDLKSARFYQFLNSR
jgi:hypothetical protein